ncbi:MAG TPA: carboxypeptidase regulatory-like domain-containing protein [Acidobacteriota bacterium]|nr:carboxypeptidase regulatory-like domain-containing protein [Acidobacteriota bacterium]
MVRKARILTAIVGCLLAFTCSCGTKEESAPSTPAAAQAGSGTAFNPSMGTAVISGKATFEGTPPAMREIKMDADPVCVSMHAQPIRSEEIVVSDGNLANVFVYVKEGLEKYTFTPPSAPAELNQEGCSYKPHVGGIMVGQVLKIINSDPTTHNVHCTAENNPQFNLGQALKGMEATRKFSHPEVMVHFKCDVHKWMSAYLGVLPHPYFSVTGKDGTFSLKNLPPGDYVIEAWQEKLGAQTQKVTVGDKETKEINFSFRAPS